MRAYVRPHRWLLLALLLVTACASEAEPPPGPPLDVGASRVAVVKARRGTGDHLLLLETLVPLADVERPPRALRRFRGEAPPVDYTPPAGASLADFAVHPGDDVSILLVTDAGYSLERWSADGSRGGAVAVAGAVPAEWSHDAGRIAPLGDDVILALRIDTNAVEAFRYQRDGDGYRRRWDALVEPPNDLLPRSITSGSFDTFGQLKNPFRPYLDVSSDGGFWVGVAVNPGFDLIEAHNAAFGEDLRPIGDPGLSWDVLVTRLDGDGGRRFSRMVGTTFNDEMYGLRAAAGEVLIVGRAETTPDDPGGWDGLIARVDDAGSVTARTVPVDAGDIFFDADVLADGRVVAVGGAGYTDNPDGASISEACSLLAVVLAPDATTRLSLPSPPRHNHLRTLIAGAAGVWVGGLSDGPGTHSGDGDPSLIRAEPFVAALPLP